VGGFARFFESLTNHLDSLTPTAEGFGDPAVRIRLQQNLGASHFLATAFELPDHLPQCVAFLMGHLRVPRSFP
jgi:hypothetical protein